MEEMETYSIACWDDSSGAVEGEEVICGMDNDGAILVDNEEFEGGVCEEVVVQDEGEQEGDVMYIEDDGNNMIVMQQSEEATEGGEYMEDCQVTEEVIQEPWNDCPELVVAEEHIVGTDEQATNDDIEIPLPTDQDQYTAARPYPCDFCSRRFRKKANLMNHMVAHQTDRPHGCNLCGVRYIRKCDLMNHLKIHAYIPDSNEIEDEPLLEEGETRKRVKPFGKKRKNKLRGRDDFELTTPADARLASSSTSYNYIEEDVRLMDSMDSSYLAEGNSAETEPRFTILDPRKPFVCQHCGVGFAREKALASHARIHEGDGPYECRNCEEVFWDPHTHDEHMRLKHGGMGHDFGDEDDDDDEDYSDEDSKYGQFFCPTCGMSFHRQDNLKRHQRIHVKEEFSNDPDLGGHVCNVCGESFSGALELLAHAEVHTRSVEHRCMICGDISPDEQTMAAHVQVKHGKSLPPHTCMMCGRTCKDHRALVKHSFEHSKEKMFACTQCDKMFHNRARLKRHMISHRSKTVQCDVCGEEFADGRSLMNHRHSHSNISGRQFPCRECGKTFGSRSSQQIHIRIHTGERPYGCRYCWKAFADGGTLRKHERIHTGEKPYACAVCPRAFNQRVVLREHIRSHHSGPDPNYSQTVTPYSCAVCSDLFSTSQDLIVHLIHHCDLNTAMKRQPQVGPRKYKRRRKLKPHELELMTRRTEEEENEEKVTDSEDEQFYQRKILKKIKKSPPLPKVQPNIEQSYADVFKSFTSAIENINSIMKQPKTKRKLKPESPIVPSRPKMIHTQKARVAVEGGDGLKVRHKMKTLVTHTQPTELKSATGERMRPRTKNVNYHILQSDKLAVATFPEDDAETAVNNLLASENSSAEYAQEAQTNGIVEEADMPAVSSIEEVVPTNIIKVQPVQAANDSDTKKRNNSLKPGRHIIGPGSKVVRIVKGGMIISKNKAAKEEQIEQEIVDAPLVGGEIEIKQEDVVKQEVVDPSPLHELAEISMQHAQSLFKCEMCSAAFADREQLRTHVSIHI